MGDSIINIAFLTGFYIDCVTMKSFFEESAHVFFPPIVNYIDTSII